MVTHEVNCFADIYRGVHILPHYICVLLTSESQFSLTKSQQGGLNQANERYYVGKKGDVIQYSKHSRFI